MIPKESDETIGSLDPNQIFCHLPTSALLALRKNRSEVGLSLVESQGSRQPAMLDQSGSVPALNRQAFFHLDERQGEAGLHCVTQRSIE